MNVYVLLVIALIAFPSHLAQASMDNIFSIWHGTYIHSGYGGTTAGGSPIIINTVLTITSTGGCQISRDGFQTMERIYCSVSKVDSGINILFKSYSDGKIENEYGTISYKPNEKLFSLHPIGQSELITTVWGSLKPDFIQKKRGVFFKRK